MTTQVRLPGWLRAQISLGPVNCLQTVLPMVGGSRVLFQDASSTVPASELDDLLGAIRDLGEDSGYAVADGFRKPLFKGYDGALLDGFDDRWKKPGANLPQPATHVAYAQLLGSGFNVLFSGNTPSFNVRHEVLYNSFANSWRAFAGTTGAALPNVPLAGQGVFRHYLVANGNDGLYEITDSSGSIVASFSGNIGTATSNGGITLGGPRDDSISSDFFSGHILCYSRYDRVLSPAEKSTLSHGISQ